MNDRLFAIVDIETTGGHASSHGITEIAIVVSDGTNVIERFETLINPRQEIPIFIQSLTGISDEMVADAPLFSDMAERIYQLLEGKIFVAHNVNFDYSFVNYHLKNSGYLLNTKKLCTVRLARKVLTGYPSYSLGKLCKSLNITIENRHRAMGDALATSTLLSLIVANDTNNEILKSLKVNSKEQLLPPHLPESQIRGLPHKPGVYYFKDKNDKIIYVGKAINLYKRVCSHFSNNNPDQKKQSFLRNIRSVSYEVCGTELQALILETLEIKRLWPAHNRALKKPESRYGLYVYETQAGYLSLGIGKKVKFIKPYYSFNNQAEGFAILKKIKEEFSLCPKLSFLQDTKIACSDKKSGKCFGACERQEDVAQYNTRVKAALTTLMSNFETYMIVDEGREKEEKCCILVENGSFYGMGFLHEDKISTGYPTIKEMITPYPSYIFIQNLINDFALNNPAKRVVFS